MNERRSSQRHRTFKGGSIIYGLSPAVDCVIRNMSEQGAAIESAGAAFIPDTFDLLVKPEMVKRRCRVIWRDENRIGVQFV